MNKAQFSFLIILTLTFVPAFVAAITIMAVPFQSSIAPFPRPAAVAPQENVSTTFQPTLVYVQVSTVTTTVTSTTQATVTESTTSVQSVSVTEKSTETVTTTSTSVAGLIGGLDPSINTIILIGVLGVGAVIGGTTVRMQTIWQVKRRGGKGFKLRDFWVFAARTADGSVEEPDAAPPRGFCGRCGKPAQNNLCTGCGLRSATCTCSRDPATTSRLDPYKNF